MMKSIHKFLGKNHTSTKHQTYNNLIILISNFIFSTIIVWGVSGASPRFHDILLFWVLWNCFWFKPLIAKLASPLLLLGILYAPIGVQYGYPNAGMIASLFETTTNEVKEFVDILTIVYFIVTIGLSVLMYRITKPLKPTTKQYKFFKYFLVIITILFITNIISFKHKQLKWQYSELLNIIPHTMAQYDMYMDSQKKIQEIKGLQNNWQINEFKPNYSTYVLVIGESASKNYLSAYGYPVKTSPFIDNNIGTTYLQAIAPAGYTTKSVPRLLTNPNPTHVEFQNNIITLANKVGMETYWVSNQDKLGVYENEIYYIANSSQQSFYLSDIAPTSKRYDYQLLPIVNDILTKASNKPKLIVLHLMGSHARFSKRVDKSKPHFNFDDKHLSDYLSSLLQTDIFLENLHQMLKEKQQPFSVVYIADHALTPTTFKHGLNQFSLQVPLFKLSSDDVQKQTDNRIISGFGFIWFLTEWLGIDTQNQKQNTFLNHYQVDNLENVKIFDDTVKPYLSLEKFDGKLLTPDE